MSDVQLAYQEALKFAAGRHAAENQLVPGTILPYAVHLSNVAMEILMAFAHSSDFDARFAVQVALLHDVLEDTETTISELESQFGEEIAKAVSALTKSRELPKEERMADSIRRIKLQREEVWAVKLADRITNLQPPPSTWTVDKIKSYHQQAIVISENLKGGNAYLENRLSDMIRKYSEYCR